MLMSKLYNKSSNSSNSSKANTSANGDPRVITPSSIPIFILPPTLDKIVTNQKPELNGICRVLSLKQACFGN